MTLRLLSIIPISIVVIVQQLPSSHVHGFTIPSSSSASRVPIISSLVQTSPSSTSSTSLHYSSSNEIQSHENNYMHRINIHDNTHTNNYTPTKTNNNNNNSNNNNNNEKYFARFNYLHDTTTHLLDTKFGSLTKGKHHELYSTLQAWSNLLHDVGIHELGSYFIMKKKMMEGSENDTNNGNGSDNDNGNMEGKLMPALLMESIVKRIIQEQEIGQNSAIQISTQLYNHVIDAWCTIATSIGTNRNTSKNTNRNNDNSNDNDNDNEYEYEYEYDKEHIYELQMNAIKRSTDILQQLQNTFEQTQNEFVQPNIDSFHCIIEAYSKLAIRLSSDTNDNYNDNGSNNGSDNDIHNGRDKKYNQIKNTIQKGHYIFLYQEYLYRTNKNQIVQPTSESYAIVMDMYSKSNLVGGSSDSNSHSDNDSNSATTTGTATTGTWSSGRQTEQILRLMEVQGHVKPDTNSYNLVISTYLNDYYQHVNGNGNGNGNGNTSNNHRRRKQHQNYSKKNDSNNHNSEDKFKSLKDAQRIFDEMQSKWLDSKQQQHHQQQQQQEQQPHAEFELGRGFEESGFSQPDITSYTLLITSWANCKKRYSAQKAQELLFQLEDEYYSHHENDIDINTDTDTAVVPSTLLYNTVMKAWCQSNDPNAAKNALLTFQRMKKAYRFQLKQLQQEQLGQEESIDDNSYNNSNNNSNDKNKGIDTNVPARPDRNSFNLLLHTISKHGTLTSLQQAESILDEMQIYEEKGYNEWAPNLFSYNIIIEGYRKRMEGNNRKSIKNNNYGDYMGSNDVNDNFALKAYRILQKLLIARKKQERRKSVGKMNIDHPTISPNTFSFNNVIFALSKSGLKQSALLIEEILLFMEKEYDERCNTEVRPDVYSYSSAIAAWARSGQCDAGSRAEALLLKMEERYANYGEKALKPNVVTFNSVIDCYAKSGQGTVGARKAEQILERMECMYSAGDDAVKPNVNTYNSVLSAWARSDTKCAYWKSQAVLDKMWRLYEAGNEGVKPDSHAYNTVISAVSRSQCEDKAQKALRILREMDSLYRSGEKQNEDVRPNEITYTCVLNSCAYSNSSQYSKKKALDTAIFTLEELMASPYGRPNHVTYGMFLTCCANLIPSNDERRRNRVVEPVFLQCCKDGQVNELVLNQLRLAAPADLYEKLLGTAVQRGNGTSKRVRIEDLPPEWRCNVRNEKWKGRRSKTTNRKKYHKRN